MGIAGLRWAKCFCCLELFDQSEAMQPDSGKPVLVRNETERA